MRSNKEKFAWLIEQLKQLKMEKAALKEYRRILRKESPVIWLLSSPGHLRRAALYDDVILATEDAIWHMSAHYEFKYRFGDEIANKHYPFPEKITVRSLANAGIFYNTYNVKSYPISALMGISNSVK